MNIQNTCCVVTGARGATGKIITDTLCQAGAQVVGTRFGAGTPGSMESVNDHCSLVEVDLTDPGAVRRAVRVILKQVRQVHVWINVVGGFDMGKQVEEVPSEAWQTMWSLNFLSCLHATQAILPHFKANGVGRLINFGSAAVEDGMEAAGPYLVSKAAVHALTLAVAREARGNITCNALLPTIIDTPANRSAMPDADTRDWISPETIATHIIDLIETGVNGQLVDCHSC